MCCDPPRGVVTVAGLDMGRTKLFGLRGALLSRSSSQVALRFWPLPTPAALGLGCFGVDVKSLGAAFGALGALRVFPTGLVLALGFRRALGLGKSLIALFLSALALASAAVMATAPPGDASSAATVEVEGAAAAVGPVDADASAMIGAKRQKLSVTQRRMG